MDNETKLMHLIAGAMYGEDPTCTRTSYSKPKIDYAKEETAVKSAEKMSTEDKNLEAYPCFWCGGWHIGRAMTVIEEEIFRRRAREAIKQ